MLRDLILAVLHHVLAFGLVSLIVAEGVLLRGVLSVREIDRLARLDRAYGIVAGALIAVGVLRVIFGDKGYQYFIENPWFWAKMVSFAAVGLLSIAPTMGFLAWRRAARNDPSFAPSALEVSRVLAFVRAESAFVILVLVFAATMARFG